MQAPSSLLAHRKNMAEKWRKNGIEVDLRKSKIKNHVNTLAPALIAASFKLTKKARTNKSLLATRVIDVTLARFVEGKSIVRKASAIFFIVMWR